MCGITGIWAFNESGKEHLSYLENSIDSLAHRGPDDGGAYLNEHVGLGHRRLSIIDTSHAGHQPMAAQDGRYQLIFNGEIYNYRQLHKELQAKGVHFNSVSDTEVLLQLLIHEGKAGLDKLNGFFSLAFYDRNRGYLLIARDRLGIKPLLYYQHKNMLVFASEMQAILAYGVDKKLDRQALSAYLQLNYTPAPLTMIEGIKKLAPGHFLEVESGHVNINKFYDIVGRGMLDKEITYTQAQIDLRTLLEKSVERRLIADVPLGCFLSGGIDSSIVTAIAAQQTNHLKTFSIGFKDNPFFDETHYAELVSKKFNTHHTTFKLTNDEMFSHLSDIVKHFDEPFADSSAILVYILSKKTRNHITVALSGDGADEIFSGYNKHAAWHNMEADSGLNTLINMLAPLAKVLPKSRSGKWSNLIRQIDRFAQANRLSRPERYWFLASLASEAEVDKLLDNKAIDTDKNSWLSDIHKYQDFNDVLRSDTKLVLPNDMLKKVDLMSMASGLEVRVPFLDHEVVDFVFSLPHEYKINQKMRKKILQDAYQELLPGALYNRPKKGFEIPLLEWLKGPLANEISQHVFNKERVEDQGIFSWSEFENIKKQLQSSDPMDSHARVWALYVFQKWYGRYFDS